MEGDRTFSEVFDEWTEWIDGLVRKWMEQRQARDDFFYDECGYRKSCETDERDALEAKNRETFEEILKEISEFQIEEDPTTSLNDQTLRRFIERLCSEVHHDALMRDDRQQLARRNRARESAETIGSISSSEEV